MLTSAAMRHRFRVKDGLYAAETFPAGDGFEVRVFSLQPSDGYFRQEGARALLRLKGSEEAVLVEMAVRRTEQLVMERGNSADSEKQR